MFAGSGLAVISVARRLAHPHTGQLRFPPDQEGGYPLKVWVVIRYTGSQPVISGVIPSNDGPINGTASPPRTTRPVLKGVDH